MSKINWLLTLLSLNALLVIIERLSFTTKIILQPDSFLRLHEVVQMLLVIPLSIVISYFLLKEISGNFTLLKDRFGTYCGIVFILGVYFTATGNGVHELASFLLNNFCNTKYIVGVFCNGSFFTDYFFGNIVYFVGLLISNVALILLEVRNPSKSADKKNLVITIVNSLVLALTFFVYAGFDRVSVGLWYCTISAVVISMLLFTAKASYKRLPFALYSSVAYVLATLGALIVRMR